MTAKKQTYEENISEIDKILEEEGKIQVECHFCGKKYDFGKEDFENL